MIRSILYIFLLALTAFPAVATSVAIGVPSFPAMVADVEPADTLNVAQRDSLELEITGLREVCDSLEREISGLREVCDSLRADHERILAENRRKDMRLKELEAFEAQYLAQLAASFDSEWAAKPYADMDIVSLDEAVEMSEKYSTKDKKIAEVHDKFAKLHKELEAYSEASRLNREPYDYPKAQKAINALTGAVTSATPAHQQELNGMISVLKNYRIDTSIFQDLIREVDETAAEFGSHAASIHPVREVLAEQDKNLGKIKEHPWLSVKYKEYVAELEKDCKSQGAARNEIMSLKIKE